MQLNSSVSTVPLIGPAYATRLVKLDINTIQDLLLHIPTRYNDLSVITPISHTRVGDSVTIEGTIESVKNVFTKNRKLFQEGIIADNTGKITAIWFNQPFLTRSLKSGKRINLAGKIAWWNKRPALVSPEYEVLSGDESDSIHTGRLVPIYPETAGISSKWLRSRIAYLLKTQIDIEDSLPKEIIASEKLLSLTEAIHTTHFPKTLEAASLAKKRLAFDELLRLQISSQIRRHEWSKIRLANKLDINTEKINQFISSLPFTLTPDQEKAIQEILDDLSRTKPMNRLLEGDVGSGKTVVAAVSIFATHLNNKKSVFLAPTQILANQHFQTLDNLLSPFGISVTLVTSGTKSKKHDNSSTVFIGTHALLHQKHLEEDKHIGLVIIDEQHRFGVEQRSHFFIQKDSIPHLLSMTATPIPRTITLTLHGDLDLSQIKTKPIGRQDVTTWVVPREKRLKAYEWIKSTLKQSPGQAFIVCPFIEPSESQITVKAAKAEYEYLKDEVFPELHLALLHGKISQKEKDQIMNEFRKGGYDILVTTPIVEVGVDIPKAIIIVIEDADKFGLAQLHQLRGRVGRGDIKSYCLLFTQQEISPRLKAMEKIHSGIELAELDLKLRGPGDIYGNVQHGYFDLKFASYSDLALIETTKSWAQKIALYPESYPALRTWIEPAKISPSPN